MRLVYTGRLVEEQKRVSDLTRAFCRVVCEVPHTEAVIYGGGPAEAAVKQIISVEGKGLPVYFAGRIDSDQVQEHLLAAHVLVLLSDYEGLPISLMEAMACGVVPVCLRVRSGIPELVEDGITGLLVDDRGDAFISAVRRLREDPYLWERLSRAARAKVEASYSNEVCAMHWGELLRDLWKRAKPRPLSVPKRFSLPPVHAGLAREDQRQLPTISLAIQKARRLAGRIKRACFAVFHAKNHERVYPY
ncbi:MAG: glycosyltransferase family 4 protein [Candidatus Hadarchaeum sp.]